MYKFKECLIALIGLVSLGAIASVISDSYRRELNGYKVIMMVVGTI